MENDHTNSFLLKNLDVNQTDSKGRGEQSDYEKSIWRIEVLDTAYSGPQETQAFEKTLNKRICSASANEIDEKIPELKDLPSHLEYTYLNEDSACSVIVSSKLTKKEKASLLQVLEKHKGAIAWKMSDIKGISPSFCTHKILLEENSKPVIQPQRHSPWVSPIHVVPKKGGITVVLNDNNKPIPSRTITGWRVCIDYLKLNDVTRKDHFPFPFIDQMLERLSGNEFYCFLDGFSGFFQIPIAHKDQEKTTFTCPYGTFAYRRMPFGLCNAPATFQRCMTAIFHDMAEDFMKVFMDDFSVFGVVLGQRIDGNFKPIYYASKTLNDAQAHYTTTEKELLAVVFSFDKFHPYLILSKTVVYTDHSALKYLFSKQDAKTRLIRWVLLLQGFNIEIKDKKGAGNLAADHLSRLENPNMGILTEKEIADEFPDEHLMVLKTTLNNDKPCGLCVEIGGSSSIAYKRRPVVVKFLKGLFARFGVPKALISDRGTHFCNSQLEKALQKYGVSHKISMAYHPQTNGQTEVTNRAIKRILERSVGYNLKDWSEKLNDALWAFRTAHKTPTGCTLFRLVYGKACHLPVEVEHKAYWALKQCNMDLTAAAKNHFMALNELMDLRDEAYENTRIYKEKTKKWHESRLRGDKNFTAGDKVLLFNSRFRLHPRKLKSKWSGPFTVKTMYPYGAVEITNKNNLSFKVNGHRLKKYYGRSINTEENEEIELNEAEVKV
ncbi:reverse transcriptase domain-containing protein [Tanacetum coccineum]